MDKHLLDISLALVAAWIGGMAVGLERSINGRAAGFRTHALVSLASATIMIAARMPQVAPELFAVGAPPLLDPSRLIQGLMTGVGFLGAGVIFKEGVSIQGLTTAASIWATAAFGALFGLSFWAPAIMAAIGVILTLTVLRWVEMRLSTNVYALAAFQFDAALAPTEADLVAMLTAHNVIFDDMSFSLKERGAVFEYSGVMRTRREERLGVVARQIAVVPGLIGLSITRISK